MLATETIGWLGFSAPKNPIDDFDLALKDTLATGFLGVSVISVLLSAALAMPLTFLIVRRIAALVDGTQAISRGDYSYRVTAQSNDEITQLSRDFNHLAQTLEQNETARKRWIADISHELRTPLAITSGELEAMEDGVRELSINNVRSAREGIKHLQHLVDDLYELTNADIGALSYHKQEFDLVQLVNNEIENFKLIATDAGLKVEFELPERAILIWADMSRMKQLIQNILGNSEKYTETPGQIRVSLSYEKNPMKESMAKLTVEDSAPGVASEHLNKLFDHLYRVEASRNRSTGGSGLGLAICRQIVLAHNGEIVALPSTLGGLSVSISLPLNRGRIK
jgi:two-component system sensor histidine kinase BaeS